MKKISLITILIVTTTAINAQVITEGLVGYWPLNDHVNDVSGNANHGTINNAISASDREGNLNGAFSLDGSDNFISISDSPFYSLTNFSVSIWVYANDNSESGLISKGLNGEIEWGIHITSIGNLRFYVEDHGTWGPSGFIEASPMVLNEWILITATYDGSDMVLYVNDQPVANGPYSGSIKDGSGDLLMGAFYSLNSTACSGESCNFNGSIDDIAVYNRALSDFEVFQIYLGNSISQMCTNVYCIDGKVGIGTYDTKGYELAIAGKTVTEEVKVALIENWPDYVFEPNYKLRTIEEVEIYVNENKHLPEIPSKAEVNGNGINLGEMDAKLLQKIEELTMYMISINKEMKELKVKNQHLEEEVLKLKNK